MFHKLGKGFKNGGGNAKMPLFGPNIKKMKEKGDIDGLVALIKADDPRMRVEAIEALLEIKDHRAMELLVKEFNDISKLGDEADKVEAITIMQGRAGEGLMGMQGLLTLPWDREAKIIKLHHVKFTRKFELSLARPILLSLATNPIEASAIRWYSVVALVELGDRSNEVMQLLTDILDAMPKMNIDIMEESVRALSYFPSNPDTIARLIQIQKGHFLRWKTALDVGYRSAAIYALAASGDPSAREYLEYLATHGDEFYQKRAQVALKLFGNATYDEIKAKAESK
jgi:HEAT repeat protein